MDHSLLLSDGGLIFFKDERDLDQLATAFVPSGFVKISGEVTRSDGQNQRKTTGSMVIFREAVVSLS